MKKAKNFEDGVEFAIVVALALVGVNMVWGIFLLPWGVLGMIFAALNLFNVFMLQRIKSLYRERRYEESASKMLPITIIGAVSGFVFYGYYLYTLYSYLDDIVMKKYLIRSKEEPIHFPPPYIPKKRD